jgi:tetratricopeptide (TPR) repeat protein
LKKFKLVILSLLISTSASAQQPALPELDLPDLTLEEGTENKAAEIPEVKVSDEAKPTIPPLPNALAPVEATKEQNKVLNKAIDEVFSEADKKQKTEEIKPEDEKSGTDQASSEPEINDSVKVIEVSAENPLIESNVKEESPSETIASDNPEIPAVIQPEETTSAESDEVNKAEENLKAEEQKTLEPEANEVEQAIKEEAKPVVEVKKEKPAKKIVFPKQTPKSLRQNYNNPLGGLNNENNFAPIPMQNFQPVIKNQNLDNNNYKGLPENTRPIMLNNNWKKNKESKFAQLTDSEITPKSKNDFDTKPKSLRYTSLLPSDLENKLYSKDSVVSEAKKKSKSDLDILSSLPEKQEKLNIKSDIKIDEAEFNNPFAEEVVQSNVDNSALAESEISTENNDSLQQEGTPVVDFSDNEVENIENLASAAAEVQPDFYSQELGLKVEVKDRPTNNSNSLKNAYEALKLGQYESAIEYYKEVLAVNPKNNNARFGLATSYHKSRQLDNAKNEYLKIINENPKFWPAVNNYIMLVTEEDPASSISKLEELQERNPSFAAIPAQLGSLYFNKGDYEKAAKNYIEALKIESGNIDYKYNLAITLEKAGNFRDAAEVYRSLLEDYSKGKEIPENPMVIRDRYDMLTSKSRS